MESLKEKDFFLTGSGESIPLFYYSCAIGVQRAAKARLFTINYEGISKWFIEKQASKKIAEIWMQKSTKLIAKEYFDWKKKWKQKEKIFLGLAKSYPKNWKKSWEKLDKISEEFWEEAYFVESIDPFAEDIEKLISTNLVQAKIDPQLLSELITPFEPTRTQKAAIDFNKISSGEVKKSEYVKKYWYFRGSWIGGEMLNLDMLVLNFLPKVTRVDYTKVKEKQKNILLKLNLETRKMIYLLQTFTLWREERKAYMQMMSVAYTKIAKGVSKKENIPYNEIIWARPEEIDQLKIDKSFILNRKKTSVLFLSSNLNSPRWLCGKEAQKIIDEFIPAKKTVNVRGNIACKGIVQGRARIVLREHHFGKFQEGEILITTSTRPEFVPLMGMAAAIVCDEGGLTSHAAIVSRELKKPCIVGTKNATQIFSDGDLIEVDANTGIVKKL